MQFRKLCGKCQDDENIFDYPFKKWEEKNNENTKKHRRTMEKEKKIPSGKGMCRRRKISRDK